MAYQKVYIRYPVNTASLVAEVRSRLPTGLGGSRSLGVEHEEPRQKAGVHLNSEVYPPPQLARPPGLTGLGGN